MGSTRVHLSCPSDDKDLAVFLRSPCHSRARCSPAFHSRGSGLGSRAPTSLQLPKPSLGNSLRIPSPPAPAPTLISHGVGLGRETRSRVRLRPPPSSQPQQRASWTARLRRQRARGPSAPGRRVSFGRSGREAAAVSQLAVPALPLHAQLPGSVPSQLKGLRAGGRACGDSWGLRRVPVSWGVPPNRVQDPLPRPLRRCERASVASAGVSVKCVCARECAEGARAAREAGSRARGGGWEGVCARVQLHSGAL